MKVLRLDDRGVKQALKHKALEGKKPIGRGSFCMVYEGSRKDRVLKLTADESSYWMLNDGYVRVTHRHFPRVRKDFGCQGDTRIDGDDYPLYLYETERLQPVSQSKIARGLMTKIEKSADSHRYKKGAYCTPELTNVTLALMAKDRSIPLSLRNALSQLAEFCDHYRDTFLDLHSENFMQRANGELVINDPIACESIYRAAHRQLSNRGY